MNALHKVPYRLSINQGIHINLFTTTRVNQQIQFVQRVVKKKSKICLCGYAV